MAESNNLKLKLIDTGSDDLALTFREWRLAMSGSQADSNMQIIDRAIGNIKQRIDDLNVDSDDVNEFAIAYAGLKQIANEHVEELAITWTDGGVVSVSGDTAGHIVTKSGWKYSEYIDIEDALIVHVDTNAHDGLENNAFYSDKLASSYICGFKAGKSVAVPDGAKYVRLSRLSQYNYSLGASTFSIDELSPIAGNNYVTPEMFGAVGDGVHDDAPALKAALESDKPIRLINDLYVFSVINVYNHDVDFDGCGHTIHVDLSSVPVGWNNAFAITIGAEPLASGTSDLKIVSGSYRESIGEYREIGIMGDSYTYGYISYKGCIPMPQWILRKLDADEGKTETYYNIVRVQIKRLTLKYKNCTGKVGLRLAYCVESRLDDVKAICEYGHDGMSGLYLTGCSDVVVNNCTAENWTHRQGWSQMGTHGYGLVIAGDNIRVTNYHGINNRDHIAGGGNNGAFWASRCIVDGAHLETDGNIVSKTDGRPGGYFEDGFESHGNCYMITFQNIIFVKYNEIDTYRYNGYLFEVRTPYAIVKNIEITGAGVMNFPPEFTEESYMGHVIAPDGILRGYHGSDWQRLAMGKEVVIEDSVFAQVESFICATTLKLVNCVVRLRIWEVSHLVMINTVVYGDQDWMILSPVMVYEDAQIMNCDLYHNGSTLTTVRTPLISAPPNSVQAVNNRFRIMPGTNVFTNEQKYAINNVTEHRFGLILTSDYSRLDTYYPFDGGETE